MGGRIWSRVRKRSLFIGSESPSWSTKPPFSLARLCVTLTMWQLQTLLSWFPSRARSSHAFKGLGSFSQGHTSPHCLTEDICQKNLCFSPHFYTRKQPRYYWWNQKKISTWVGTCLSIFVMLKDRGISIWEWDHLAWLLVTAVTSLRSPSWWDRHYRNTWSGDLENPFCPKNLWFHRGKNVCKSKFYKSDVCKLDRSWKTLSEFFFGALICPRCEFRYWVRLFNLNHTLVYFLVSVAISGWDLCFKDVCLFLQYSTQCDV